MLVKQYFDCFDMVTQLMVNFSIGYNAMNVVKSIYTFDNMENSKLLISALKFQNLLQ